MATRQNYHAPEALAARYRGGETLQAIADSIGITRERVRQIVSTVIPDAERRAIAVSNAGRPRTETNLAATRAAAVRRRALSQPLRSLVSALLAENKTYSQVAAELNITRSKVAGIAYRERNVRDA